jgi:hypothetical protein
MNLRAISPAHLACANMFSAYGPFAEDLVERELSLPQTI